MGSVTATNTASKKKIQGMSVLLNWSESADSEDEIDNKDLLPSLNKDDSRDTLTVPHNNLKNKCVEVTCYPIVDDIGLNERSLINNHHVNKKWIKLNIF